MHSTRWRMMGSRSGGDGSVDVGLARAIEGGTAAGWGDEANLASLGSWIVMDRNFGWLVAQS